MSKPPSNTAKQEGLNPVGFFSGMPGWIKGIVYLLCVPTVVATLSIMMLQMALQIPFGPIFQEAIQKAMNDQEKVMLLAIQENRDQIVESVNQAISERLLGIETELSALSDKLDRRTADLEERVVTLESVTNTLNTQLGMLEQQSARLTAVEEWICDNDGFPPEQCTLENYIPLEIRN